MGEVRTGWRRLPVQQRVRVGLGETGEWGTRRSPVGAEDQTVKGRSEEQNVGKGAADKAGVGRTPSGCRSLTAEGAVPPDRGLAGPCTLGCIGLQGAAQGQDITLGPTLAMHTTGKAGFWGYRLVALGEGAWRRKPQCVREEQKPGKGPEPGSCLGQIQHPFSSKPVFTENLLPET